MVESSIAYWGKEADTYTLLTHVYIYFRDYWEMLEKTNPKEAAAFSHLNRYQTYQLRISQGNIP